MVMGFGHSRLKRSSQNIFLMESDLGKQVVQSTFGIVKHGGVGPWSHVTSDQNIFGRVRGREETNSHGRVLLGTNIAPTSLDSSATAWGQVLPDVIAPWTDDDGAVSESCILGPTVEGGMPEKLAVHLRDNQVNFSAFDGGDFQDWNVARPQPQWPTSTPDWEKWLPRMEHFFGQ
ncbi:unnamed protein product, partial [Prunus brigantina]